MHGGMAEHSASKMIQCSLASDTVLFESKSDGEISSFQSHFMMELSKNSATLSQNMRTSTFLPNMSATKKP